MQRIKDLTIYAKILLVVLIAMAVVFAVVYVTTISREGILHEGHILVPGTENGNTIYTAEVKGEQWRFTVTPDKTVTFRCGNRQYGPYTAKEDPTAIPAGHELANWMTGVEVREGEKILFRGGIHDTGSYLMMINEDGTSASFHITVQSGSSAVLNGQIIEPMEPSVSKILALMKGPELTHKGHGGFWFLGLFVSLVTAVNILFADELFRLQFIFQARNVDRIEPSDFALAMRPIAWTILVLLTLWTYYMGLR